MSILVTGGAGYIGSHTVLYLKKMGLDVVVFDSLQKGHREAVLDTAFVEGDLNDPASIDQVFKDYDIDSVIHFAADSLVGESVQEPLKYYHNNVIGTYNLVEKMVAHGVKRIVFSSTAATYGEPENVPIKESDRTLPTNPYGETKLAIEKMLRWCDEAYGLKSVCLRYFNAAGADPEGRIGEDHSPETHLIPLVLETALGKRKQIAIFGSDYPTKDGSCVRDYIHVMDLAQAHYLAVKKLEETKESAVYNLGNGEGFSVHEVIDACRKVTGKTIPAVEEARRPGDPAVLIAAAVAAKQELGWEPAYPELETIVAHAWEWHQNHPEGFRK